MRTIRFASTRLADKGKQGILPKDANGYRTMTLGGLNCLNSSGDYYTYKGAEDLFKDSSILMRRIKNGNVKAELGHPKPLPNMTENQYLERILRIEETNVCAHIKELWLDFDFGKANPQYQNPGMIGIMGKVKPAGPHEQMLENALNNPDENVNFSIRALSINHKQGYQTIRVLDTIVTFDCVTEQGIEAANKWDAPALESLEDRQVTIRQLEKLAREPSICAMESTREMVNHALESARAALKKDHAKPLYKNW